MAATNKVIEGIQILVKYMDKADGFHLGAEHDVLYFYPTDRPVTEKDVFRLRTLGWRQEDVYDSKTGEDGPYDPKESWSIFV